MKRLRYVLIGLLIGALLGGLFGSQWNRPTEAQITSPALLAPMILGQAPRATVAGTAQLTGIDSSTAVAITVPTGARFIEIQAEDQNLRWRSDGTSPTSSVGNILYAGTSREFWSSLSNIELIATTGTAKANFHYSKYSHD